MKHIKNFNNVTYLEANENCSHTNCFLVPIIPNENKKGRLQRFACGEPNFHDVKYLVAFVFKYQVSIQLFSFATIAINFFSVLAKDVGVDEP
jgi:hypothetical protein